MGLAEGRGCLPAAAARTQKKTTEAAVSQLARLVSHAKLAVVVIFLVLVAHGALALHARSAFAARGLYLLLPNRRVWANGVGVARRLPEPHVRMRVEQ